MPGWIAPFLLLLLGGLIIVLAEWPDIKRRWRLRRERKWREKMDRRAADLERRLRG